MRLPAIAALLILASASAAAQEPSGCDKFKWPLDKERATLNGTCPGSIPANASLGRSHSRRLSA
jgi:hypothetical protein